jgi:hypothetical protein
MEAYSLGEIENELSSRGIDVDPIERHQVVEQREYLDPCRSLNFTKTKKKTLLFLLIQWRPLASPWASMPTR